MILKIILSFFKNNKSIYSNFLYQYQSYNVLILFEFCGTNFQPFFEVTSQHLAGAPMQPESKPEKISSPPAALLVGANSCIQKAIGKSERVHLRPPTARRRSPAPRAG
jgi:hypothetical protein